MRIIAALFLVLTALFLFSTPAFSDPWASAASGETPYLNRAQGLSLVPGGKLVAVGYLGDSGRSWDWVVEMFDRATGKSLWRDRIDAGSDRAHSVVSTTLDDGRVLTVVAGRIAGNYSVRAYLAETGEVLWEDRLPDIGDAYTVHMRRGRVNVTGTRVHFDSDRNRQALYVVTRSYVAELGALEWERKVVEGDATRVTESDPIDSDMSHGWYAMVTWVNEPSWSGTMLRVLDNETGQLTFIHRFPEAVKVNAVIQRGKRTVVAGERETVWGSVAHVWAFNARRGKMVWDWEAKIDSKVDAENSSAEDLAVKDGKLYVAVNRWIDTQCQIGTCRFGERRGLVRAGLLSNGDLHWEFEANCAIRDLAANRDQVVVAGVTAILDLASPSTCGDQLNREFGYPLKRHIGIRGDIYAAAAGKHRTFVAGESHEPYPSVVNYFVGAVDNAESRNP